MWCGVLHTPWQLAALVVMGREGHRYRGREEEMVKNNKWALDRLLETIQAQALLRGASYSNNKLFLHCQERTMSVSVSEMGPPHLSLSLSLSLSLFLSLVAPLTQAS